MRTVVRVLSTLAMLLAFVVVSGADAQAQRRRVRVMRQVTVMRHDNGLHRGWTVGRHRGWSHSRHYGVLRQETGTTVIVRHPRHRRDVLMRRVTRDERFGRDERFERERVMRNRGADIDLGRGMGRGRGRGRP